MPRIEVPITLTHFDPTATMHAKHDSITCAMVVLLVGTVTASFARAQPEKASIGDKTLLAWVQLASLDQRGGSVLTLQDLREFDGIVFGEIRPGVWMPGSHLFHRTETRQNSWPVETAGPGRTVQVAIVYRGAKISLYRDGQLAAEYETQRAHLFQPPM